MQKSYHSRGIMRTLLLAAALVVALANAGIVPTKSTRKLADVEFLKRQKSILDLLVGIGHGHHFKSDFEDFDVVKHADHYERQDLVKEFAHEWENGFLPQDEEFSLNCHKSRRQAIMLFDLFYFAKDFSIFYKTACWARKHVNGMQFAYALYVAVYHRADCHSLTLPPLYEVFPHYFVTAEMMHKFQDANMEGIHDLKLYYNNSGFEHNWHGQMFGGVVLSSHDSPFSHLEERLSYFREDVGLNDYLAQMALLYPTWMDTAKYPKVNYFRRGELYYYMVQQVYARYAMERTANFLPKTEMLMWDHPIKVGYNPRTTTPHGRPLLPRANYMVPKEFNPHGVWKVERIERIVLDALDSGLLYNAYNKSFNYLRGHDATDSLGKTLWGSKEYYPYGSYVPHALQAIGYMTKAGNEDELVPSAMASLLVMSRDPAFYQLLHRLINIFQHHKEFMPCYTKKELSFPSVKIDTLDVGPLATYFDYFDMSVTNGIPIPAGKDYKDYHYTMRQRRLNHKSFTYKMSISSDESIDAMIRVFIGPKYDSEERPLTLEQARMGFVEIDRFPVKLSSGENMIERNSKESAAFTGDQESFAALYKRVETCITTKEPFYVTESFHCGLPERFMLPKGWHSGFTYQMFVIATPFDGKASSMAYDRYLDNYVACGGPKYYDGKPYGFPFDRRIDYKDVFHQANSIFKDVKIYHKDESDLNRPEHQ